MLRALAALHPAHRGYGQALHPQGLLVDLFVRVLGRVGRRPRAAHAASNGRVPGLRRVSRVFLRRRHHEVPLREAGGLLRNHVPGLRPDGQWQGAARGFHHGQETDLLKGGCARLVSRGRGCGE